LTVLSPASIREVAAPDRGTFERDIATANEPVVIRGLVSNWPFVAAARESNEAAVRYLTKLHNGVPVNVMTGPAGIEGRLFYMEGYRSLNFKSLEAPFAQAMERMLREAALPTNATVYVGCASASKHWPAFSADNPLPLLEADVVPNLWIGTRAIVGPHNDAPDNLACVVLGRRRFRLFPPEQFANLYIGPLEFNPAGRPVSFVSVNDPDFDAYPRYRAALAASREALLGPGDAIYIPSFWWHSVESIGDFNILANYWWSLPGDSGRMAEAAMMTALMAFSRLAPRQQQAWRAVFDHLVFRTQGDPLAHIPPDARGWLGELTPDLRDRMKNLVRAAFGEH
jgi:hypothetical protein